MTSVTRTVGMILMYALSASVLPAQFMDLSSFAGRLELLHGPSRCRGERRISQPGNAVRRKPA